MYEEEGTEAEDSKPWNFQQNHSLGYGDEFELKKQTNKYKSNIKLYQVFSIIATSINYTSSSASVISLHVLPFYDHPFSGKWFIQM